MREKLEKLSAIKAPVCVTIILNTHKTAPDNKKDPILLKNLISEASKRLENEFGADVSKKYTDTLNKIAGQIDHTYNDHGLMLYVNDDVEGYLRLPTNPHARVIIDETFATRSIIRAIKRDTDYYILALSKGKARLIEANSDEVVQEATTEGFPFTNDNLFSLSKEDAANAQKVTNITQEFFNRVDKAVNKVRAANPQSVIVYSEETNYHQYLKEVDLPDTILGHIVLKNFDTKAGNLVKEVWPTIKDMAVEKNRKRISELEKAMGAGKVISDINEVWTAVQEGRGHTIFVEEGFFQAVKNEEGILTPIDTKDINHKDDIDDIVDEMIEHTLQFGGDVVFLEENALKDYNKLALVTRY